jgi:NADPH:quinone reductase-like Zn-dependent oxidoreductase
LLRSWGADYFIDYTKDDYTKNGKQYDRILDVIAHRSVSDYKRALKPGGIFAMIGGSMGGLLLQFIFIWPILSRFSNKKLGLMGYKPARNDLEYLNLLVEEGELIPVIDKCYPLEEVPAAFKYFSEGNTKGKIIINIFSSMPGHPT